MTLFGEAAKKPIESPLPCNAEESSTERIQAENNIIQEEFVRKREAETQEFEKHFKYGATIVYFYEGRCYFWGDVSHCGEEAIFHNAREIKRRMGSFRYGHMNFNDMPTFENPKDPKVHWERQQWDREKICMDDLYCFEGSEIVLVKKHQDNEAAGINFSSPCKLGGDSDER